MLFRSTFLIDGYNLMYATGLAGRNMPAAQFDRARVRFLDWLADGAKARAQLRVVFDAQEAPAPSLETVHCGVRVRFAFRQTADDVIEQLVATEPEPHTVAVVSNDSRVREAARRAGCAVSSCEEFIDWLITSREWGAPPARVAAPEADKPVPSITDDDMNEWLNAFNAPKPKR